MVLEGADVKDRSLEVISELRSLSDPEGVKGMVRFGISTDKALGVRVPELRRIAKNIGKDHLLANALWEADIHETRILATMVDDPKKVTEEQMDRWVMDFRSWDVCDQCCMNLFDKTPYSYKKMREWSQRSEEYVKRAAFALMASTAVHDKKADDAVFMVLLPLIKEGSLDERNFVKKAVNWALRQIGKRNLDLNRAAIEAAEEISRMDSKAARWVAADALRELRSDAVKAMLSGN